MPLYRLLSGERKLQLFRSIELRSRGYLEQQLEDWLEANPPVLVGDEPLMTIGRQVITPVGTLDLLALDADGVCVVIELKRGPNQREAFSQVLEYAAWVASLSSDAVTQMSEAYLRDRNPSASLADTWHQVFNTDFDSSILNARQRLVIAVEGDNERLNAVVRYLRASGVDIGLVRYNYYWTEAGEEILDIERVVGDEGRPGLGAAASRDKPTEDSVLAKWSQLARDAYVVFRDRFLSRGLILEVKRSGVSFAAQTREGRVFISFFASTGDEVSVWLRPASLRDRLDFQEVATQIKQALPGDVRVTHTGVWFIMAFAAMVDRATSVADLVLREVVERLDRSP